MGILLKSERGLVGEDVVGYLPPAEFEKLYYQHQETPAMAAGLN